MKKKTTTSNPFLFLKKKEFIKHLVTNLSQVQLKSIERAVLSNTPKSLHAPFSAFEMFL